MPELSVIVPWVNEWPLIASTIRGIGVALKDTGIDFEVLAVDNWMPEVGEQKGKSGVPFGKDRSHTIVESLAEKIPWLRVLHYHERLSHWQAKNHAVSASEAPFLMFMDAHCVTPRAAISAMFNLYREQWEELNGSIHLPLTYHLLEEQKLIYRMRWRPGLWDLDYVFQQLNGRPDPLFEVPCMSTCGMMIHRDLLEKLGKWPTSLGIYGGGEHFINYAMAVTGMKKWVFNSEPLYHHGEERGYKWNGVDYETNRLIAIFCWSDAAMAYRFAESRIGPSRRIMYRIVEEVISDPDVIDHRDRIQRQKKLDIMEFIHKWDTA